MKYVAVIERHKCLYASHKEFSSQKDALEKARHMADDPHAKRQGVTDGFALTVEQMNKRGISRLCF